jgi:two-component system NtrC family sensor kinase
MSVSMRVSSSERAAMRRSVVLFLTMVVAIVAAAVTLYVDAAREGAAAVADFAFEQQSLAAAVAIADRPAREIEVPGASIVVERGADGVLRRPDGTVVKSDVLAAAMARGDRTVRLSRPEAAAVGLPMRTAVAGIAKRDDGRVVSVVATALRVRDREKRAQSRLLLGIAVAALLVGFFGGIALRIQRKEHQLERELLLREAQHQGEERLARADKLATMGAFATGIAHEIATPLGVIAARTEMLGPRLASDERGARAIQAIGEQIEKIRGIIKSFLALSRGEHPAQTRVAARDVLASARAMVEHRFTAAQVALDVDAPDERAQVFADPRLLEQALVNLLLNACDASTAGKHVHVSARVDGGRVMFRVEDEGTGISPEVAARATEPFFTTKPAGKGSGLGLAIVNEIAKHHQGRFVIGPRSGGGTEARLELPAADAPKAKERAA